MFIGGYAGAGKSELGQLLARATGWAILDKDTLTRPIVEAALRLAGESPDDREGATYLTALRPAEYEALFATVVETLECGVSCIVVAPFVREYADPAWLDHVSATCGRLGAAVTWVWVRCDADSMLINLRCRGAARDAHKLANWPDYLASIDLGFRPAVSHQVIDTSADGRSIPDQVVQLIEELTTGCLG